MQLERGKNASRNMSYGFLLKLYEIVMPFIMRTVIMQQLGAKYLGLNGLFGSILHVLNLAELGVGSAMVFSMYRPIAENDTEKICAYMRLYRLYYRVIGLVILAMGLAITPFLPKLVHGDVPPDVSLYTLYFLNLGASVLSYWLFAYRNSILYAHQRGDIASKVSIVTHTMMYSMQLVSLICFHNYYFYVIARLLTQVVTNISAAFISKRKFPAYDPRGKLPKAEIKDLNGRVRDLFTSKVGGTIVSSADTIVISAFLGLEVLAKYQNYYAIMNAVVGFIIIIHGAILAGVGNSMLTKSEAQNHREFNIFTFLIAWLSTVCVSCFMSLYQPFMTIWMGKDMLLDDRFVFLFGVYFWAYEVVKMISVYKDAGGIWHKDRFRPLITGLINLGLNLLMVRWIGLYGIIISTIIGEGLISTPWIIKNVYEFIFPEENPRGYVVSLLTYTAEIFATGAVCWLITSRIPGASLVMIILKGIVAVIVSNILFILIFGKNRYFSDAKGLLMRLLHPAR